MKKLRMASILSFIMAIVFGVFSIFTFTVRADEEGTTQSEAQVEDQIDTQSASNGESVRRTYGSAFGDGSNESIMNPGAPTGYDEEDTSNPYGATLGEPFLIFPQSELFTYAGSSVEATSVVDVNAWAKTAIYDTRKGTNAEYVLGGSDWHGKDELAYGDLLGGNNLFIAQANYVQTV